MAERRRRLVTVAVAVVVAAALATTVATDVAAHRRDRAVHARLVASRSTLAHQRTVLAVTTWTRGTTTAHRDALRASVADTLGRIATTRATLTGSQVQSFLQGVDLGTLHTCLGGVQQSLDRSAAGDPTGAAQAVSAVAAACTFLEGTSTDGLVYPFDFPDPSILRIGGTYYAYGTNSVAGDVQILTSPDLVHWTAVGDALAALPAWATPHDTWAPSVLPVGTGFVLYYTVRVAGPGGGGAECISLATATQPTGPFVDTSTGPFECQPALIGSIDPSAYVDPTGTPYLVWKSNGGGGASALWSQQLDPTGTAFAPATQPTQLLAPDAAWQGGVIEAPDMVSAGGRTFLFYSGNAWDGSSYAEGVASCTGPTGPCADLPGPILASGPGIVGPGSASVVVDPAGTAWLAFDAWSPGAVGYPNSRALYIRRLDLSGPVPSVAPAG